MSIPAGGYIIRMYLIFTVLTIALLGSLRFVTFKWRKPAILLGTAFSFDVASMIVRPWVNASMVSTNQAGQSVEATLVSTGLLPVRISSNLSSIILNYGQKGLLSGTAENGSGIVSFLPHLHLHFWQWFILIAFCCLPTIISLKWLFYGNAKENLHYYQTRAKRLAQNKRNHYAKIISPVAVIAVIAVVSLLFSTQSVDIAQIRNTQNTAAMNKYYTCLGAALSECSDAAVVWGLNDNPSDTTVTDNTPQNDKGKYSGTKSSTTNVGCVNDTPKQAVYFNGSTRAV